MKRVDSAAKEIPHDDKDTLRALVQHLLNVAGPVCQTQISPSNEESNGRRLDVYINFK